jgi:hypothetical protein
VLRCRHLEGSFGGQRLHLLVELLHELLQGLFLC